ncbi:unnamed protein product [Haemonchus placei]|uniref:Secreted protein n=1 Tax=Haemonchus placei TaxID=6290 RepID=A0A0N4WN00_HAEPC|nr:unnamed protein product [Haemonchus placei]
MVRSEEAQLLHALLLFGVRLAAEPRIHARVMPRFPSAGAPSLGSVGTKSTWLADSLDLNLMENVWGFMMRRSMKQTSSYGCIGELKKAIVNGSAPS